MTKNTDDIFNSPGFNLGSELGISLGHGEAVEEVKRALEMGEVQLFVDHYTPKTLEGWDEWYEKHGGKEFFKDRWGKRRSHRIREELAAEKDSSV